MSVQYPGWYAGQKVTAARLSDSLPQFVYCTTNLDRVSTTTLAVDPVLQFPVVANAIYIVEFTVFMGGGSAATGPNCIWTVPAATDGLRGVTGPGDTATSDNNILMRSGSHGLATQVAYGVRTGGAGFSNLEHISEVGTIFTTNAGTVAFTWGQKATSTTAVRRGLSSWGRCTRVG